MAMKKKTKAATNETSGDSKTTDLSKGRDTDRQEWMSVHEPDATSGYRGQHRTTAPHVDGQTRAVFTLTGLVTLLRLLSDEEQTTQAIHRVLDSSELAVLFGTLEGMARDALVAIEESNMPLAV
jgi:hypothetical protein